ncbi:MAG: lysylphosphatidylglycerol synthase transmembrane domain-containing protein [bacterium]
MADGRKKIKIVLRILGPAIFIYILFQINYGFFFAEIKSIGWPFLILAVFFTAANIIFKSLRWRTILLSLDIAIGRAEAISLYWLGLFVGAVTPGRFGELIKIYFLKIRGRDLFRSFFSIILDRLSDIMILLGIGLLISFFFLEALGSYIILLGLALVLIIMVIILLLNQKSWLHRIFGRFIKKIFSVDFEEYDHFSFKKLWRGIIGLRKKDLIYFFVFLILSWFFYFLTGYVVSLSLGLSLSLVNIIIITSVITLVITLPISIAGLGTREVSVIYLFGLFGLSRETAVLYSLLIFMVDILTVSLGIIPYFKESALVNRVKNGKIT